MWREESQVYNPNRYDILRETWIYQEIRHQVEAELEQHHQQQQAQHLLEIVQARFPRLHPLILRSLPQTTDLQNLLLLVAKARNEKEVKEQLFKLMQQHGN